jgi:hypothetical protein
LRGTRNQHTLLDRHGGCDEGADSHDREGGAHDELDGSGLLKTSKSSINIMCKSILYMKISKTHTTRERVATRTKDMTKETE